MGVNGVVDEGATGLNGVHDSPSEDELLDEEERRVLLAAIDSFK